MPAATATAETPYQLLPPLPDDIYEQLKADIAEHGIRVPVDVDEHGSILDGHHRTWIALELGIDCPQRIVTGLTDEQKRTHAVAVNVHRRSLSREQRRELIRQSLQADPQLSDRQHADRTGTDHKTVGSQRSQMVTTGEIPQSSLSVGADGTERVRIAKTEPVATDPDADLSVEDKNEWIEPSGKQIPEEPSPDTYAEPKPATAVPVPTEPRSLAETNKLLPPALIAEVRDADRRAVAAMRLTDQCEDLLRITNPEALALNAPEDMAHRIAAVRPAIDILTRFITTWENR